VKRPFCGSRDFISKESVYLFVPLRTKQTHSFSFSSFLNLFHFQTFHFP
jgi:hypothetical protein